MSHFARCLALAAALSVACAWVVPAAQAQYAYSITELGSAQSFAYSGVYVDNAGDVAYSSANHVELYSDGTTTTLGSGRAVGISNSGTVLGSLYGTGTVYSQGTSSTLGLPSNDELYAISGNGQYLAGSVNSGPNSVLTLFSSTGTIVSQTTLAPNVVELSDISVNNSGVIIGQYETQSNASGTFIESNGAVTLITAPSGGSYPSVGGLNDSGVVVGQYTKVEPQGFVDTAGTLTTLTGLAGNSTGASGINDSGQIVGSSIAASGQQDAVIFQNNVASDLNSQVNLTGSGFASLNQADYISNTGIIVGSGTLTNGQYAIFELTPGLSAVPEPTTYLLWTVLGLGGLAVWRQRQRKLAAAVG